jgi:hypothetical protein
MVTRIALTFVNILTILACDFVTIEQRFGQGVAQKRDACDIVVLESESCTGF